MENNRIKNSIRNFLFGLLKYIVTIMFPFFIRTVLIYRMGTEYAGLTSLFSSILQVLSLSEFGFSTVVVYSLYAPVAKNDIARICSLLSFFRRIYKYCGLFILLVGLGVTPFVNSLISGSHPEEINIHVVFVLLLVNTAISYLLFGYKTVLFSAHQRDDVLSKAGILSNLLIYSFQFISLAILNTYYMFIISMIVGTLVNNILLNMYSKKMFPHLLCKGDIKPEDKRRLFKSVGALFGHQLDTVIINSADNIIISMFLGLNIITMYNNYYYILSGILSVMIMITNSFAGSIGNSIAIESREKNYKNFLDFTYFIGLINSVCVIMLFLLYQDFMIIWMGREMLLDIGIVFLISFSLYVRQFRRTLTTYKIAAGIWNRDWLKPYVAGVVNLVFNFILIRYIGLYGVLLSTIFSFCVIEIPWETYVFFQGYFKNGAKRYLKIQLVIFVKMICIGGLNYYIFSHVIADTILMLLLKAFVMFFLVGMMHILICYKDNEFEYIVSKIKTMIN